ncbi:MAG: dTDP-4-dehydrorhamnose 3,5-epimerase family protein [Phycisphaerales bacterium]
MKISETALPGLLVIDPAVHGDDRGFFLESWNGRRFAEVGIDADFTQDNHSRSVRHVLRGLHYQAGQHAQGKLVRATAGEVFDVVVDLRRSSPTFGRWHAEFQYKCTGRWNREAERTLAWNDPAVGVQWPLTAGLEPILSVKDRDHAASLATCETFA